MTPARKLMQAIHGCDVYAGFLPTFPEDTQGWNADRPIFGEAVAAVRPEVVINVGVWKGASVFMLSELLRRHAIDGAVIAIDHFLGDPSPRGTGAEMDRLDPRRHGMSVLYEQFLSNVARRGETDRIVPFAQTSTAAAGTLRRLGVSASQRA